MTSSVQETCIGREWHFPQCLFSLRFRIQHGRFSRGKYEAHRKRARTENHHPEKVRSVHRDIRRKEESLIVICLTEMEEVWIDIRVWEQEIGCVLERSVRVGGKEDGMG